MVAPQKFSDDPKNRSWMQKQVRPMMLQDRMHGFLFFESFLDFRHFDLSTIDPLQRANVPLLERDTTVSNSQKAKTPLMLMTDYGSCNPHEAVQGAIQPEEQYYVQFWQHIDVFNYFAHGHIAIPPPTWINAAHRNGVQIIGTLIFEGGDDAQTYTMLEVDANGVNWLADKLAHVAAICGFDGWLLNVESSVHKPTGNAWAWDNGKGMINFITSLQSALKRYQVPKGGKVIWYDAVTRENICQPQEVLNDKNIDFARTAKSVIVDYGNWDATNVQAQTKLMDENNQKGLLGRDNVYLGRIIFRQMGNGLALKPAADAGVGSGLFATGWCFQQFSPPADTSNFRRTMFRSDADKYMWTGAPDLAELQSAGVLGQMVDNQINTQSLTEWIAQMKAQGCITAYAREYTAGSQAFFYTNYGTSMTYREKTTDYWAHLNEHSVWPALRAWPQTDPPVHIKTNLKGALGGCAISVENRTAITDVKGSIFLHYVHLKRDVALALTMRYKRVPGLAGLKTWLCAWTDVSKQLAVEMELTDALSQVDLAMGTGQDPIVAVGLRVEGPVSLFLVKQNKHILDIDDILVKPQNEKYDTMKVEAVELIHNAEDVSWTRLKWNVPPVQNRAQHLPYSVLTASFSHFDVFLAGNYIGRSHTLAYVWDEQSVTKLGFAKGASVEIRIEGTQFDGTKMEVFKGQKIWP